MRKNIIIVKEIKDKDTYEDLEKTAQVIVDMLNTEAMARVRVAFGTIIKVSRKFQDPIKKRRWHWMLERSFTVTKGNGV